jgi:hypothetical protein
VTRVRLLPRCAALVAIAALGLALGGLGARGALALFTSQATVTGNTFSTASCFSGDTGLLDATAQAADTGGDGNGFEVNPTYAFGNDALYAENINGEGDRHRYYNYGMSISSGCPITGIEVRLDWWLDLTDGDNSLSVELSWDGGSSWTAAKTDTEETLGQHTAVFGAPNDTWGRTWNVSELSDANFRVRVTCNTDYSGQAFSLDWVPVKVHYIPP